MVILRLILLILFVFISPLYAQQAQDVNLVPLDFGIKQTVVAVTTSATALPTTVQSGRKSMVVKNECTSTVYIGSSTVTADNSSTGGLQLDTNEVFQADIGENTILYGVISSGTCSTLCVIEAR